MEVTAESSRMFCVERICRGCIEGGRLCASISTLEVDVVVVAGVGEGAVGAKRGGKRMGYNSAALARWRLKRVSVFQGL